MLLLALKVKILGLGGSGSGRKIMSSSFNNNHTFPIKTPFEPKEWRNVQYYEPPSSADEDEHVAAPHVVEYSVDPNLKDLFTVKSTTTTTTTTADNNEGGGGFRLALVAEAMQEGVKETPSSYRETLKYYFPTSLFFRPLEALPEEIFQKPLPPFCRNESLEKLREHWRKNRVKAKLDWKTKFRSQAKKRKMHKK